jgi:hypothetical protein
VTRKDKMDLELAALDIAITASAAPGNLRNMTRRQAGRGLSPTTVPNFEFVAGVRRK